MKNTEGRKSKSKAGEQMESEMEDREELRREKERDEGEDLNQSIQTGTHDSERLGVNWPPSYRNLKKRKPAAKRGK
ncbi:MAG: hypothetical protein ACRD4R_17375 [Candidatus Acidiferrales bacterium]